MNIAENNGFTPLMFAAHRNYINIVAALIQAGANVNRGDKNGETALMKAADGGHDQCVAILLRVGANVNVRNRDQFTALMFAVRKFRPACINLLTQADTNIEAMDILRIMKPFFRVLMKAVFMQYGVPAIFCCVIAVCLYFILSYGLI